MNPHALLAFVAALFVAVSLFSHTVAARLLLLATGIVLAVIVLVRARAAVRPLPPIWIPFALWAGWALLSLTWSVEPERSLKEWRNEVFYTGAALWICYIAAQAEHAPRVFLCLVGAATLELCLLAIIAYFSRGYGFYQQGLHGGPGNLAAAILTLMPCALAACWYSVHARWPQWMFWCAAAVIALLVAAAHTTLNRTLWMGLALELILLAALIMRRLGVAAPRARAILAGVVVACVAGASAVILAIQSERETHFGARPLTEDSRFALWPEILERAGERPLTGYGFGRGLLRASLQKELREVDGFLWHAHNIFLEALVQTGLPGMLLFIALLAAIARAGWRLVNHSADQAAAACGIALLGVLTGMLVRNMTDTLLVRQNALLFWAITGILLGLAARPWRTSS